jgi:Zn-finger nucleic acid-binding protein
MNCQNCGAPMQPVHAGDHFYCEYCTSFYFPKENLDGVRLIGEPAQVECFFCKLPLYVASIGGIRILTCEHCKGILVPQPSFLTMVNYLRGVAGSAEFPFRPIDPQELRRRIMDCPQCKQAMDTHPYYGPGNVVIDVCPRCRVIWLDYSELYKIINSPGHDRGRLRRD